jgi:hypothetical protein
MARQPRMKRPEWVNDSNILALGTVGVLAIMGMVSNRKAGSKARWGADARKRDVVVSRARLQFDSPSGDEGAAFEKADEMAEDGTGVHWVDETDYRSPSDIDIDDLEEYD